MHSSDAFCCQSHDLGPWWLPDPQNQATRNPRDNLSAGNLIPGGFEDELLSLASRQRMNTEVRKAVFCVIMGAQDVLDACEKLLRMPLKAILTTSSLLL